MILYSYYERLLNYYSIEDHYYLPNNFIINNELEKLLQFLHAKYYYGYFLIKYIKEDQSLIFSLINPYIYDLKYFGRLFEEPLLIIKADLVPKDIETLKQMIIICYNFNTAYFMPNFHKSKSWSKNVFNLATLHGALKIYIADRKKIK